MGAPSCLWKKLVSGISDLLPAKTRVTSAPAEGCYQMDGDRDLKRTLSEANSSPTSNRSSKLVKRRSNETTSTAMVEQQRRDDEGQSSKLLDRHVTKSQPSKSRYIALVTNMEPASPAAEGEKEGEGPKHSLHTDRDLLQPRRSSQRQPFPVHTTDDVIGTVKAISSLELLWGDPEWIGTRSPDERLCFGDRRAQG